MQTPRELPELPVVCHGMRRKGESAVIGVIPNKIAAKPPTAEWYHRYYEEVPLVLASDYAALATRLAESEARAEEYKAADESMQAEVGRLHAELYKLRAEIAGAPVVEVIEHEVVEVDARRIETWGAIPFVDASMIGQRVALLRLPAGGG